jgi:hypothetical protein
MFAALLTITLFIVSAFADINVPTQTLTQCKDVHFTWDFKGEVDVVLVSSKAPCGDFIKDFGDKKSNSFTWNCDLPVGTEVELSVLSKEGDEGWSGAMTVGSSDDRSCLPSNKSSSSSSTPSVTSSTYQAPLPTTSSSSGSDSGPGAQPVGAANSGNNPLSSGALTMRRVSSPAAMVFSVLLAAFAVTL